MPSPTQLPSYFCPHISFSGRPRERSQGASLSERTMLETMWWWFLESYKALKNYKIKNHSSSASFNRGIIRRGLQVYSLKNASIDCSSFHIVFLTLPRVPPSTSLIKFILDGTFLNTYYLVTILQNNVLFYFSTTENMFFSIIFP